MTTCEAMDLQILDRVGPRGLKVARFMREPAVSRRLHPVTTRRAMDRWLLPAMQESVSKHRPRLRTRPSRADYR